MKTRPDVAPRGTAQRLLHATVASALLLGCAAGAYAQGDESLAPMGGSGGTPFLARCPQGELLTGMDIWAGIDIDAIRPICVPAVAGQFRVYPTIFGTPEKIRQSTWASAPAATARQQLVCPNDAPIVIGMDIRWEGRELHTVDSIHLYCGQAIGVPQRFPFPQAVFDAPGYQAEFGGSFAATGEDQQRCPPGLVAVGIDGRAGLYLDAVGLICGAALPPEDPNGVRLGGRVLPQSAGQATRPICDLAREARARNSPAAPGLEGKCRTQALLDVEALAARGPQIAAQDPLAAELRNQQAEGAVRRGFDIGMAAAEWQTSQGPGKQRLHDALDPAEQQGFSTAVSFSLARNRQKLADLDMKGATIAGQDPLAGWLRSQQANDSARRGFDVGMAAAEGQTAPGPGKDKIRDALPPEQQGGFTAAVQFSLERNRNAQWAAEGAAIVNANPGLAAERDAQADAFYRLGFDIATGFSALQGNGTGAMLKLRDTLSAPVRRGFDAALESEP